MLAHGANPCVLRRMSDDRRKLFDPCLLPSLVGVIEVEGVDELVDGIAEIFAPEMATDAASLDVIGRLIAVSSPG